MPRRMSVWPVAIQTLTPLGIGIIATSEAQAPAAVPRNPHPGQRECDSRRSAQFRLFRLFRAVQEAMTAAAVDTSSLELA